MAFLGGTFDASQVEPQGDYTPIPPGEYKVQIISSEMVETNAKTGSMLKLELEIVEGDQAGRKLFDRLNLDNPTATAVEIAQRTLSAICHAVGKLSVSDSEELHMLPLIAVVKVEPAKPYKDRNGNEQPGSPSNSVKTYKAAGAAAPAASGGFKPAAPAPAKTSPWAKKNAA